VAGRGGQVLALRMQSRVDLVKQSTRILEVPRPTYTQKDVSNRALPYTQKDVRMFQIVSNTPPRPPLRARRASS